jgi:hypothetical protein
MKHSIPLIAFFLACSQAYAAPGDSAAQAATSGVAATPALAASASISSDGGLATEDASHANEQSLLGLPRVPKDSNLGAMGSDGTASTTHVALRRPAPTHVAATTKRVEVFTNPYPTAIYPAGSNHAVYKNPW